MTKNNLSEKELYYQISQLISELTAVITQECLALEKYDLSKISQLLQRKTELTNIYKELYSQIDMAFIAKNHVTLGDLTIKLHNILIRNINLTKSATLIAQKCVNNLNNIMPNIHSYDPSGNITGVPVINRTISQNI